VPLLGAIPKRETLRCRTWSFFEGEARTGNCVFACSAEDVEEGWSIAKKFKAKLVHKSSPVIPEFMAV
jgi:hypothetical protein